MAPGKTKRKPPRRRTPLLRSVEYVLGKGSSRLLDARVDRHEIRLLVNGPAMLVGSVRMLTSLDMAGGATHQAWNALASALECTSYCGLHGVTKIPVTVKTSRIGTFLEFGTGPMSMYQSTLVLKPKRKGATMRQVLDEAFGRPRQRYTVVIVPEAATGHLEHDASIFDSHHEHGPHDEHGGADEGSHGGGGPDGHQHPGAHGARRSSHGH